MRRFITTIILLAPMLANASALSLPKCDEVDDVLKGILAERTEETGVDLTFKGISAVREIENNENKDIRLCYGLLQTPTYNKLETLYSISPKGRNYWMQIEDAAPIIDSEILAKSTEILQNQLGEDKLKSFEIAKKYGDMTEACLSLNVAKGFFLDAKNEEQYIKVNELLKENCSKQ